jgi:hypothetical protein
VGIFRKNKGTSNSQGEVSTDYSLAFSAHILCISHFSNIMVFERKNIYYFPKKGLGGAVLREGKAMQVCGRG